MGEQSDPHREMEAGRMASMEPAPKQANRGSAADAVGASHSGRRADSESGSCRHAAKRRSRQRSSCCLPFVCGGSVCVKHTVVGISRKRATWQQAEASRSAQAAQRCGVLRRRQGQT
jgi:hypothetical protein